MLTIAIIDTGVDFSNPDMQHSLARDNENIPIMLDPDGQGLILTNVTFAANIDRYGTMKNFTKSSMYNTTSDVYVKSRSDGVFLNIEQNGLMALVCWYTIQCFLCLVLPPYLMEH